ncbi:MAG: SDR family NAD(P)-dependent oxidoreductase [Methanoculleus sp.]
MAVQTILATGSTDGIGKATAHALSRQGRHVLLHGKNREKGEMVIAELEATAASGRLDLSIADLLVQEQIRDLAAEIAGAYDCLDVLVNNAGVFIPEREITPAGIEMTFAVNFLAQVLLIHELLPLLKRSAPVRIANVASIAHWSVWSVDRENLPDYDAYDAYALSKLGVVAFTARLARALEGTEVTANPLHPGVQEWFWEMGLGFTGTERW